MINEILDFSKIEAGKLILEDVDFDPEEVAYDVCELVQSKIARKPILIFCRIGDRMPRHVNGDQYRFRQVLLNLLGNAVKFTKAGEIELSLDVLNVRKGFVEIETRVRDTGIGIAEDKLDAIFDPFLQADGSSTRKYGGTGLGLSICRQLSELMHGSIRVESKLNEGSTFYFTCWMKKADRISSRKSFVPSLAGKKVLLADTNRTQTEILSRQIEAIGMRVFTAAGENIPAALKKEAATENPFAFCMVDILNMDEKTLRLAGDNRGTNVQATSASGFFLAFGPPGGENDPRYTEAGFNAFLRMPLRRKKLVHTLKHLMNFQGGKATSRRKRIRKYKNSLRVLLAEDNIVNQKLLKAMLAKTGIIVEVAANGKEALDKFIIASDTYDLILMDVQMPEMDGIEATEVIRRNGHRKIPIIALTASAMAEDRQRCLKAGMNDFLSKPAKMDQVLSVIKKWSS